MSQGLKTTFQLLARTDNAAAGRVLLGALDSPRPEIQEGALRAVLRRPDGAGHREVLRRIDDFDDRGRKIVREHAGRMTPALRDAIGGGDPDLCRKACLAAVWFRQYDLAPALLGALEGPDNPNAGLLGRTLLDLVGELCSELGAPREDRSGRDPQLVRRHLVGSLELSVKRFVRHRRREVLEAFAVLVYRDNITLKQVLEDPHDSAFVALVDLLAKNAHPSVIGLLLSFLDDPHAPSAVLSVISRRRDLPFVDCLLQKTGRQSSSIVAQNLRRMESIAWARAESGLVDQLDDLAQPAAVRLVMASGTARPQALSLVESVLRRGKPGGRQAAAEALAQFHGAEANQLVQQALGDEDPEVQALAVGQLRGRGIPGAMTRLIESLDSPHAAVRRAARESLPEFAFEQFLSNFDFLDDDIRRSTGMLVRKIDPRTIPQLRAELASPLRTRRLRAVAVARALALISEVEDLISGLLGDEDHMVRAEAAGALGLCATMDAREALAAALGDRSPIVREAVRRSLAQQGVTVLAEEPAEGLLDPQELPQ